MPVHKSQKGRTTAGWQVEQQVGRRKNVKKPGIAQLGTEQFGGVAQRRDTDRKQLSGRASRALAARMRRSKQS